MVLTSQSVQRLAKDVKYIKNNPLTNIYYKHDEENILFGYALIIGKEGTPYEYGYYLFKFEFPENYPFQPPNVKFLTNDGVIRFNPNLYTNGLICLSILNTWKGDGWTSCQTIHSILLVLSSILNEKPLLNEPGVCEYNINIEMYNTLIFYKNIEFAILKQFEIIMDFIEKENILYKFKLEIYDNFIKNKLKIYDNIKKIKLNKIYDNNEVNFFMYKMIIKLNSEKLYNNFYNICEKYNITI